MWKRYGWMAVLSAVVLGTVGCQPDEPVDFETRLEAVTTTLEAKLNDLPEGQQPDLEDDLAALDQLVREESGTSPENAARALLRKVSVQLFYLEDKKAGEFTLKDLVARFPGTPAGEKAERMLASLQIQAGLVPGAWFPDFAVEDLSGAPLHLGSFRGQVLLVDFWATWCPPCRAELPNVLAAYENYHDKGFSIVGISLDQDRSKLESFMERNGMTWPQFCDGLGWRSPLVDKYGVMSIPTTYLLDREGRIVASDLRGDALQAALSDLLDPPAGG